MIVFPSLCIRISLSFLNLDSAIRCILPYLSGYSSSEYLSLYIFKGNYFPVFTLPIYSPAMPSKRAIFFQCLRLEATKWLIDFALAKLRLFGGLKGSAVDILNNAFSVMKDISANVS